jgi:aryl-alcohol dehydrogenase-like predicted oxidoreductase
MRYVDVGGVRLSSIGLGTWQFGSRSWDYGATYAGGEAIAITRRALELGINLIDTAEIYGFGKSERIVGRAIEGHRDQVFLATKLFPLMPLEPVISSRAVGSAHRLGVSYMDLYQLHWPNPAVPVASVGRQLTKLVDIGLVRHLGVSNFSLEQWQQTEAAAGHPVLSNQVQYSLAVRNPEAELTGWAASHDRLIIAYSPLAQGLLSGRFDGTRTPKGTRSGNALFLPDNIKRASELLGVLRSVAKSHQATPAQVALAWLIRRPNVVAIPGASSLSQLESNAAAADLDLTESEDAELTAASDGFHPEVGRSAALQMLKRRLVRRG